MKKHIVEIAAFLLSLVSALSASAQITDWDIGLTSGRTVIQALGSSSEYDSARTVLVIAGLDGPDDSQNQTLSILDQYDRLSSNDKFINLIVIPLANPDTETLQFPPTGRAYAENPVSHALWRWIGVHGPDLVVIIEADGSGFREAIETVPVAGVGTIPAIGLALNELSIARLLEYSNIARSPAGLEIERRLSRSPIQLAEQLAQIYGHDFSTPAYVPGMGLIGRMRLGYLDEVENLIAGYLDGDPIAVNGPSVMAGQLVFAEHGELTGNPVSQRLVVNTANLAFDEQGNLREAMPYHAEMSDSVFMTPPLLTKAGKFTSNNQYFDMAARHVGFMQQLLLRDDGLYRHSPLADIAWSRGNAFPALGLALVLSDFSEDHPAFDGLMQSYLDHLDTLVSFQNTDGLWRQVVDYPGSFAELSSTAMIGIAIKRGLDRGWLDPEEFQPVLDKIWQAILIRTSFTSEFIDVCTSTGKLDSLDAYLDRLAIFGRDDRAGGMIMNLAIEMAR